jgi:hypothetical protein
VRQELGCEPRVAFLYRHWYVFRDGFDFWTANGRFVLYDNGRYWNISRENLDQLLGPDAARLSTPWHYWIPPGLATCIGLVVLVGVMIYFSAQSRANRLSQKGIYQEALQVYVQNLPGEEEPDREAKMKALAAGVEFLRNSGIAEDKAERSLRLLVGEMERGQSYEFRNRAVEYEQAGHWDQAIENYEQAARLREEWDGKDYDFLQKCIERVRKKQARAGSG